MRERAYRHEGDVPAGASLTNMRHHAQTVAIENARIGAKPTLDREGFSFELIQAPCANSSMKTR